MKNNPVYRREITVRARSFRLPLIILIFNTVLAAVSLFNMYSTVAQVRVFAQISYANFLRLYAFAVALEFLFLMFIMPALTSGCISGERERRTLELLFTTQMTPADIVFGKLFSALDQMRLLVISSFPVLLTTFVYGSVGLRDLGLLLVSYVSVAVFCGGIGILFSSLMRRSTVSNVCTYGTLLLIVAGTLMLNRFFLGMSEMQISGMTVAAGEARPAADSGAAVYLLLANPLVTFGEILSGQAAGGNELFSLSSFLGNRTNFVTEHWISLSLFVQAALSAAFLWGAVRSLERSGYGKSAAGLRPGRT